IAQALLVLGYTLEFAGQPALAIDPLQESSQLSQQIEDRGGIAWANRIEARAHFAMGELDRVETLLRSASDEFESIGDEVMTALCDLDLVRLRLVSEGRLDSSALRHRLEQ